jgi:DNA polymerase III subunit delta'
MVDWDAFVGHEAVRHWLTCAAARRRLRGTFLLQGPEGVGKRRLAELIAQGQLCQEKPDSAQLRGCGRCEDCVQVAAGMHPDLLTVARPADRPNIPLELLIGPRERRMREGFCHDMHLRPFRGHVRVGIIDHADYLEVEAANSLLKMLEEPPPWSIIFLIAVSPQRMLPTIRSRCRQIPFAPLSPDQLRRLAASQPEPPEPEMVERALGFCHGSYSRLVELCQPEIDQLRQLVFRYLAAQPLDFVDLAKQLGKTLTSTTAEGAPRRQRLKLIFELSALFYRLAWLTQVAPEVAARGATADELRLVQRAVGDWAEPLDGACQAGLRCLEAVQQVDANLNTTGLLESWAADLARFARPPQA